MFERINNIFIVLFFLIPFSGINAQVFIGDGLSIQENTQITIVESDLIIATDEIKGEGSINLIHSSTQNISVLEDFETNAILQVTAKNIDVEGEHKNKLALHFLPPFSEEIIASIQNEEANQPLPIRYINTEGKVFPVEEDDNEPVIEKSLPKDLETNNSISETNRIQLADLQTDYIIPIYSNRFNDERISGSADLYEFECLTAILKPPIG